MAGTDDKGGAQQEAPRCQECGAERANKEANEEANEEITHCEWCGAEYPVPNEK